MRLRRSSLAWMLLTHASSSSSFSAPGLGETIRIFRRSRTSGRAHSATRADTVMVVDQHSDDNVSSDNDGGVGVGSPSSAAADQLVGMGSSTDSVLKTEELPAPDTHAGTKEAFLK